MIAARLIQGLVCSVALTATSAMAQFIDVAPSGFNGSFSNARPGPHYFDLGAEAFDKGEFKYAIDMYQVAASWAYKPAEYNLAIMYAKGQGVPVDMPRAMAWMTLAAERGDNRRYKQALSAIGQRLNSAELDQADAILRELAPKYADKVALRRAKARWKDERNSATGSRTGFVGNLVVGQKTTGLPERSATPGDKGGPSGPTSDFDVTGGNQVDGSIAYRDLRESDDPYDSKFRMGTATVQPLIPVKDADDKGASPTESKKDTGN